MRDLVGTSPRKEFQVAGRTEDSAAMGHPGLAEVDTRVTASAPHHKIRVYRLHRYLRYASIRHEDLPTALSKKISGQGVMWHVLRDRVPPGGGR